MTLTLSRKSITLFLEILSCTRGIENPSLYVAKNTNDMRIDVTK